MHLLRNTVATMPEILKPSWNRYNASFEDLSFHGLLFKGSELC